MKITSRYVLFVLILLMNLGISAQDNLIIAFKDAASAPQNLSICGDPVEVTTSIKLNQFGLPNIKDIQADVSLFKGIRIVSFNPQKSTDGVIWNKTTDPFNPGFKIPNLDILGLKEVFVTFSIQADCDYKDTLTLNNLLLVRDLWNFNYKNNSNIQLNEIDFSSEYRDALKLPFLSISAVATSSKLKVGDQFTRTIKISNSGLQGYLKSFIYQTIQGKSASIKSITANGQPLIISKSPVTNNDTLITLNLEGTVFQGNTVGNSPGNGNQLLEPDELVTIVETGVLVNCSGSKESLHSASWGCFSKACSSIEEKTTINTPTGAIFIDFKPTAPSPSTNSGYCQKGKTSAVFTNTGVEVDPGTANMFNIATGIGLGNNLVLSEGGYTITGLRIANKSIPFNQLSTAFNLNNNSLFNADPDGPGGLADLDNDGFFDDLPRNQSITIEADYEANCSFSGTQVPGKACFNNLITSFHARLNYTDFCGENTQFSTNSYFAPTNRNDSYENCSDPDAYTDGGLFKITHEQIRNVFNFGKNCNGDEQIYAKIGLPKGITPEISQFKMYRESFVFPLISNQIIGDTLFLSFSASNLTFLNGKYSLDMVFRANCQANPGLSQFPIEFGFYCPPCDCRHPFYCDVVLGPSIHYLSPPCPQNIAYECNEGFKTLLFDVNRVSTGFTNKSYTTPLAENKLNRKAAISCDLIKVNLVNVVGSASISDSIGIKIVHANVDRSKSTVETFLYQSGQLRIKHNGINTFRDIPQSSLKVQSIDTLKILSFDLNTVLLSTGITLVKNDTIEFIGNFTLNPEGPYNPPFKKVPNFRGNGFAVINGAQLSCEDNGETFEIGKTRNGFLFPNSSNFPKGCQDAYLEYALLQVNNGYNDVFPGEYRPAARVDSLTFTFDPSILEAYDISQPEVSIPGHPKFGNDFFKIPGFTNSGKYTAKFDTLSYVPPLNDVGSFAFVFRFKALPNCKAQSGSIVGTNRFNFDPTLHYQGRYYAKTILDGSCVDKKSSYEDSDITYEFPPVLSYTTEGSANADVIANEATWLVKLCNTSEDGDAGITFIDISGSQINPLEVISMEDITNPSDIQPLQVQNYGQNQYFAFANGLTTTQNGTATTNDICNIIRIKAKVPDCGSASYSSNSGWNCTAFSDPEWNPNKYLPCTNLNLDLKLNAEDPFLDANFVNQSLTGDEICDTSYLELLVRNVDFGKAFDIKTVFSLPLAGVQLIQNNIQIAYPSNSIYVNVVDPPIFNGISPQGLTYEYANFKGISSFLDQNGLDGFDAVNPNFKNEFKLKIPYITDCNFKVGSLAYHMVEGKNGCGNPTNSDSGESLPISIKGATLDLPKSFSVSIDANSSILPGGNSTIFVSVKNLNNTPTNIQDLIEITLPAGLTYVLGSSIAIQPNWAIGNPNIIVSNGISTLTWPMPVGVLKDQDIKLSFQVNAIGIQCNGNDVEIDIVTYNRKDLSCQLTGSSCIIDIITAVDGKKSFSIKIIPPQVSIKSSNPGIKCSNDPVTLTASGATQYRWELVSNGTQIGTGETIVVKPSTPTLYRVIGGISPCLDSATILVVTQIDSEDPSFVFKPSDITIQCNDPIPGPPKLVATDDCDQDVQISVKETFDNSDPCNKKIFRTFTATDDAGNTKTIIQVITITDTVAPTITFIDPFLAGAKDGDTIVVNCNDKQVFDETSAIATDNCDPNPKLTFVDLAIAEGNCMINGYYLLMYCGWTAKDACGNTTKVRLYFKFTDNVAPIISGIPADIVLEYGDVLPDPPTVTASDVCDIQVDIIMMQDTIFQGCELLIIRTWMAMDDCMNMAFGSQNIRIKCPKCTFPDIISSKISPAVCGELGKIEVSVVDPTKFNYILLPKLGNANALGNAIENLPSGKYSLIISDKIEPICFKKIIFEIKNEGSCLDTICIESLNNVNIDTCLSGLLQLNTVKSISICKDNPSTAIIQTQGLSECIKINPNPGFVGNDTLCIIYCDDNLCDTSYIIVKLKAPQTPCPNIFVLKSETVDLVDCKLKATYCLPAAINSNFTVTVNNVVTVPGTTACQGAGSLELGEGNYSIIAKNKISNCSDTIQVTVKCLPTTPCPNIISIKSTVIQANPCPNGADLCIEIPFIDIGLYQITDNGQIYSGKLGNCIFSGSSGTSINLAKGNHDLIFETSNGCKDTLDVKVICTTGKNYTDTIYVADTKSIVLENNELFGGSYVIKQQSPIVEDNYVAYFINQSESRVYYTGKTKGVSEALFIYTDEIGTIDTAYFNIWVIDQAPKNLPIATNDTYETKKNQNVEKNLLINDNPSGIIKALKIIQEPSNGIVSLKNNGAFKYAPNLDYCGKDEFIYHLCNENGCDEAKVFVSVLCSKLTIYNGFSPNGDGLNDYFTIEGIEEFPDNNLEIYNRWGIKILSQTGYQNNWDGQWEGELLPDGTYFYILKVGPSDRYTGYLEIHR